MVSLDERSVTVPWCTWYKIPLRALHQKRTHHWQPRSITVCCGQTTTPITLHQSTKTQVAAPVAIEGVDVFGAKRLQLKVTRLGTRLQSMMLLL